MNRWLNPSHPQTLQAAVILGYISAVFGVLSSARFPWMLLLFIGIGVGAFGSANNKRWGYLLLSVASLLVALFWSTLFVLSIGGSLVGSLIQLNGLVFPVALAAAALHPHSREYQKVWFE